MSGNNTNHCKHKCCNQQNRSQQCNHHCSTSQNHYTPSQYNHPNSFPPNQEYPHQCQNAHNYHYARNQHANDYNYQPPQRRPIVHSPPIVHIHNHIHSNPQNQGSISKTKKNMNEIRSLCMFQRNLVIYIYIY